MRELRIVIAGAAGRMGQSLIRAIAETEGCVLSGALGNRGLGRDMGGVPLTGDPLPLIANSDALIDFTTAATSVELAGLCAQARIVHVLGTTGLSEDDEAKIRAAARHATIVKSGNMSLGVNLLAALVRQAAAVLPDFDVEIVEMHHRAKVDAPSGTALLLGQAAAEGRKASLEQHAVRGRDGHTGPRKDGDIGFASLRGGTVTGDHTVILAGPGERITFGHVAEDRMIFARGAMAAVRWAYGKKPGLYDMADVLGLSPPRMSDRAS